MVAQFSYGYRSHGFAVSRVRQTCLVDALVESPCGYTTRTALMSTMMMMRRRLAEALGIAEQQIQRLGMWSQ